MLKYITRHNTDPKGKPKIFFTAHPNEAEMHLKKICEDILDVIDAAIWYDDEPERSVADDDEYFDMLDDMQIAVVAVTDKLLGDKSRVTEDEIPFIFEKHIPILPIVIGSIDHGKYEKIFANLQYLDKSDKDSTAIPYSEKLKKHFNSVIASDDLLGKIRSAFDAYIFMSYRKKDRKYAKELMHLIHSNDFCRDVAIWYDEYLTPGEDFNESIVTALEKSELFVMAITPNLVNEINYIATTEYPMAAKAKKPIIPIEMVDTDRDELARQYADMPICLNKSEQEKITDELKRTLGNSIKQIALGEKNENPEHLFFIGLAYLSGIDVEKDVDKAVKLIKSAAYKDLPEAIEKISDMYYHGDGVERDVKEAIDWKSRLDLAYFKYRNKYPNGEYRNLEERAMNELARMYTEEKDFNGAIRVYKKKLYFFTDTITRNMKISLLYIKAENPKEAIKHAKKAVRAAFLYSGPIRQYACLNLCQIYVGLGMLTAAEKLLKKTLRRYPPIINRNLISDAVYHNYAAAFECLAKIYSLTGRYNEALAALTDADQYRENIEDQSNSASILGRYYHTTLQCSILNMMGRHSDVCHILGETSDITEIIFDDEYRANAISIREEYKIELLRALIATGKLGEAAEIVETIKFDSTYSNFARRKRLYYIALIAYHAGLSDLAGSIISSLKSTDNAFSFDDKLFLIKLHDLRISTSAKEKSAPNEEQALKELSRCVKIYSDTQIRVKETVGSLFPVHKLLFNELMRLKRHRSASGVFSLMTDDGSIDYMRMRATLALKRRDYDTPANLLRDIADKTEDTVSAIRYRLAAISSLLKANAPYLALDTARRALSSAKDIYNSEQSRLSRNLLYCAYVSLIRSYIAASDFKAAEAVLSEPLAIINENRTDSERLFFIYHKRKFVYSLLAEATDSEERKNYYLELCEKLRLYLHKDYLKRIERLLENKRFSAALKLEKRAIATAIKFKNSKPDTDGYDHICDTISHIAKREYFASRYDRSAELYIQSASLRGEQTKVLGDHNSYHSLAKTELEFTDALGNHNYSRWKKHLDIALSAAKRATDMHRCNAYLHTLGLIYSEYAYYYNMGNYETNAIEYYEKAADIFKELPLIEAKNELFKCYFYITRIKVADKDKYYRLAYDVYKDYGDVLECPGISHVILYGINHGLDR